MRRFLSLFALFAALVLASCGPAGPNETKGSPANPTSLLRTLPVPPGLEPGQPQRRTDAREALTIALGRDVSPAEAEHATGAGLGDTGVRTFTAPTGGTMWALVMVWPTKFTAENFALQLIQQRAGKDGREGWTPQGLPGSQGTRQPDGTRERMLVFAVGPNALIVRSVGDVPEDAVRVTLSRMVEVQKARG